MKYKMSSLLLVGAVSILGGCASPARIDQMTITSQEALNYNVHTPLKENISLGKVVGGENTNPLWTSEIGTNEFGKALSNSLQAASLLSKENSGDYLLSAIIASVDQPLFGTSLTVTTAVDYTLIQVKDGVQVFRETITTPYTAEFGDSIIAVERLKLANEGSARSNIKQLIDKIYGLEIKPTEVVIEDSGGKLSP